MRNLYVKIFIALLFISLGGGVYSQCTNGSSFGSAVAPTGAGVVTISTCSFQSEYSTITSVVAGNRYVLTASIPGTFITVHFSTPAGVVVAAGVTPLQFTAPCAGTYYPHWNTNSACGLASTCMTTTISCSSCGAGASQCTMPSAFGTVTAPTSGTTTISTCSFNSEYSTINSVVANTVYRLTNSTAGSFITVHQGSPAGPVIASGVTPLIFTSTVAGTYYSHWTVNAACATASSCVTTTIGFVGGPPCGGGGGCTNASAFGSAVAPTACGSPTTISTCSFGGEYSPVTSVLAATNYTSTMTAPGYITVHQGAVGGPIIAFGPSPLVWNSTVAGTYYMHWNTNAACGADASCHTTTIQRNTGCPPPPANDNCSGAIPIAITACGGTTSVSGNTSAATADAVATCGTTITAPGIWYSIVGAGTQITANICPNVYDTKINVYSGACASLTCVTGNDDFCGTGSQVSWFATAGVTYNILVQGFGGQTGAFTMNLSSVDVTAPTITCPGTQSINLNSSCNATVPSYTGLGVVVENCPGAVITQSPAAGTVVSGAGSTTVTLTVTDAVGQTGNCSFTLNKFDVTAPTAICQPVTVILNGGGNGSTTAAAVNNGSSDACGIATLSLTPTAFTCANVGANTVTLTVTDINGNSSTCTATVTVVDNTLPVATCQPVTVILNGAGNGSTTAAVVNNGSSDACGIATLSLTPTAFTCANVGANTVTLTVTDVNANSSTCTATVTVVDNIAPTAICQPVTVTLNGAGNGSTTAAAVNNGSSDACGIATLSLTPTAFTCANVGANTVTLTVTDVNANSSTCTATVTVVDNTAPVAICQPVTVILNGAGNGSTTAAAVDNGSSDACGIATLSLSPTAFTCANVGSNTVTLTVADVNGNSSTCTATVTVIDNTLPVANCQNVSVFLDAFGNGSTTPALVNNVSSDACGIATLSLDQTAFTCGDVGANTVTLTVIDVNGNSSTCTATVSVFDNIAPNAICQSVTVNLDVFGNGSTTAALVDNGSTDACGIASLSLDQTAFTCGDVGANTVTLTVTDVNSNISTCTATVNVVDNILPVAACQDVTIFLDAFGSASTTPGAVDNGSSDACGVATLALDQSTFDCSEVGNNTVTLTVTDVNNNSSTCTATVTVIDNIAPSITCPANIVQPNIVLNCGRVITYALPSFSDNCAGTTIAQTDGTGFTSGQLFPVGSTIQTFTATDANGNSSSCSFTITIQDVELPVITSCPSNITVNNTPGMCNAVVSWVAPTASDNCPGVTLSSNFTPGSTFPVGTTNVVYTATDAATPTANTATCSFTVTVMDAEGPVITCPANSTVDCLADNSPATQGTATATDNCTASGSILISSSDVITLGSCNGNYSIARTWTATDLSVPSNMSSCVQTITVTDVTGPVLFGVPLDASVDCSSIPAVPSPVALDNCSGVNGAGVVFNQNIIAGSCAGNYIIQRTWSATDNCGNMTSNTQNITVTDVTAPVLSGVPANTSVDCSSVPAPASPSATDDCSGASITYAETNTPGSCAGNYTLTRTWTATDGCGNSSTGTQIITVSDVSGPVLAGVPADASADCASIPSAAIVTATDNCSGLSGAGVTLTETVTAGSCAGNYVLHRTWTAVDNCGNSTSATQNITVTDVTSPVLSGVPSNISVDCASVPTPAVVTATDNCSGINGAGVVLTQTITAGSCAGNYIIHRTWSATDNCGNTTTSATQDITVSDVTGPLLNGVPANATADCGSVPAAATVTVSDNCSGVTVAGVVLTETTTAGSCAGNYVLHRTWTATDNCGNVSSATQDITVSDVTAPVITGLPASSTISCPATPSFTTPTATDDCSGASLTFADVTTPGACAGSYSMTRTWTAIDGCGNVSTATETITVQDLTAPVITTTPVVSPISCPSTPSFTMATAVDACGSSTVTFTDVTTPGACGGSYSVTRTWVASDGCGNTSTALQTIVVQDLTGPSITCNPNVVVNVGTGCVGTVNLATPSAGDACGGITSISSNHPSNSYPPGVTTVTWTATDACGNTTTCLQTVTVTAPEMDVTGNGQPIADNTLTVSTLNNTDFGSVPICGYQVFKTYIIKNSGSGNLNLTGFPRVTITGSTDFVVTTQPALSVLSPGQSVTFIVRFDPSVTGFINATVNINNTDCDENPYNFAIKGTGRVCLTPMEEGDTDPIVLDPSGANVTEETNTTEIEAIEGFTGRLYPNPSNGIFTLELSEMPRGLAEIRITDALGQVLFSSTIMSQTQYYDFSHFRAATYYLQVITNEGSFTKQLIITHNY